MAAKLPRSWARLLRLRCAALLVCALVDAACAEVDTLPLISSSVRVVCVRDGGYATGSGFVVGNAGKFALTNAHVVNDCKQVIVMSPRDSGDPKRTRAKVVWNSKSSMSKRHLDAALLETDDSIDRAGVAFASHNTVSVRDAVIAVGYPGAADSVGTGEAWVRPSITQGNVSRVLMRRADNDESNGSAVGLYQITASIGPGSSGGPLFNQYGEVIGINTEKSLISAAVVTAQGEVGIERVPLQDGVAWSQEIDDLLPILGEHGISFRLRSERRNWFWSWVDRDAVTATVLGVVVMLLLATLTLLLLRRPRGAAAQVAPVAAPPVPAPAVAPALQARAWLQGVAGPYAGSHFPLESDLVFGRDAGSCNVVFKGDQADISGRHCSVRFDPAAGHFELRDLGSANGTYVDGQQVRPGSSRRLRDGDEFYLCKPDCRFVVRSGSGAAAAAAAAAAGG